MGYADDWYEEERKREAEFNKNVVRLAERAKGVIHRLKWIQNAEWADDVVYHKKEVGGEYTKVEGGLIQWVATKWAKIPLPKRTYNVRKANHGKVGAVCSIGAVSYAAVELGLAPHGPEYDEVVEFLNNADNGSIVEYNDEPGRTKAEIKDVFARAVEAAKTHYRR